ncbi:probable ATP-dependent RNA helicase spindle-E [Neodiprion lecontei]|uniref:Probable ATP-dependent RNA helicase spindle-E n=1 Tax=Neodiprion lecontei TaxID=441921 RepID=A0A6J0BKL5_NEOLC|nr:probable ATP-dependent RNA helicase spindle-E [Neodiprion lecontei]XP_046597549.1 probable ATP-dependent RNA helicase spindle-E [Neodiprion lecontei]
MDFFDLSKPLKRISIAQGASQMVKKISDDSDDDSVYTTATGTDYVAQYVEEENKNFIQMVAQGRAMGHDFGTSVCDLVSQGTIPNIRDINVAELTKIYETFNFAYRPKSNLAIMSMKDRIVSMIETNQCVVIQGHTGCGKTTQVPQFILNSCFDKKVHCNIIVTQPRRIAAISIAKRVSKERQWPVGTLVGYQVGMVNNTSQDTRLTYCTTGVLLQKLINTKHMMDYTHIILDEVHERDQDMDFLLLVVRKLSRLNSHSVKIILMSATFKVDKFSSYFSIPIGNKLEPAPVIDIEKKRQFNIHHFYLGQLEQLGALPEILAADPTVTPKMMKLCLNLIMVFDTIDRQEAGSNFEKKDTNRSVVLVFLPGIFEIEEMFSLLTDPEHESYCWDVVVMHSSITNEEQQRIFEMPPTGYRRIILSTNISESSITVPDVKYVIDFCLTKVLVTDPNTNFQCLEMTWASKANCDQRAGRAGRVMNGRVYRMVPENFYMSVLPEEGDPEMLRAPLENLILSAKLLDMGEPKAILALSLDPPDLSNLERTVLLLKEVGGLIDIEDMNFDSKYDGYLTDLGRIMARLPVSIHIAKLFVLGHVFSVLKEAIIIGASMSVKSMFSTPFREKLKAYNAKLTWADSSCSDSIAYLNAYNVWIREKVRGQLSTKAAEKSWALRHFIQIRVLREVDAMIQDIEKRLSKMGITETVGTNRVRYTEVEKPLVLKIVIAGAFYPHYFVRRLQRGEVDECMAVRLVGGNDPTNSVYLQGWPTQQPGLLYAKQFQQVFKDCQNSPDAQIRVSFDGSSRVYLQFNKSYESGSHQSQPKAPGKISLSVYKAMKMRQSDMPILIRLFDRATAIKKAEELGIPTVNVTSMTRKNEPQKKVFMRPAYSPILPSLDVSYIPLVIAYIEAPGCFWAQIRDEETWSNLQKIKEFVNVIKKTSKNCSNEKLPIGSLVIAPFEDQDSVSYYRATVLSYEQIPQDILVHIFYIDYGNTNKIHLRDLTLVPEDSELHQIPSQAFKCVLSNLQPSMLRNLEGKWSNAAYEKFETILSGDIKLYGEIYSVVHSVVAIKLYRVDLNNEKIDINQWLIKQGFAEFKEESYLSRSNNVARSQQEDMNTEQQEYHEQQQYESNYQIPKYSEHISMSNCYDTVKLRGPYSPLEMDLINLVSAGRAKKINIEPNSVNSVLLDTDPADYHERLLIAGTVGQSVSGERLNLRNTTLMPNIHGLPSLMALIFAPTIELRRTESGSRYIGALCGLGFDPETNRSLFPDHDMNVVFDVEISLDDLQNINRLRHWMNMGIHIELCETDSSDMALCQRKTKETLFDLICKKRKSIEVQNALNSLKWNSNNPNIILEPKNVGSPTSTIFKLHHALDLEPVPEGYEEMVSHLQELRSIADWDQFKKQPHDIRCKLCEVDITDIPMLRFHLSTPGHKSKRLEANL